GTLTRFHIPFAAGAPVTRRVLADVPLELPRINYAANAGKPYRYVWGTSVQTKDDFFDSIVKVDTETGTAPRWHVAGPYSAPPVRGRGICRRAAPDLTRHRHEAILLARARCRDAGREGARRSAPRHPLPLPRQLFRKPIQALTWAPTSPTFRPNSRAALITS